MDIDDDGSVFISDVDSAAAYAAKKMVDDICFVPEVGKLYYGKVVRILPIGAFVEIAPGHDGMVHISKLENHRVEKVEDVLNLGDMTWVKFMGFDEKVWRQLQPQGRSEGNGEPVRFNSNSPLSLPKAGIYAMQKSLNHHMCKGSGRCQVK